MSFGGFGGFGEDESQDVGMANKTPTRSFAGNAGQSGDKRVRNIPVTIRSALEAALSAKDAVDLPIIYEVQAKYVEVFGQIQSVTHDASSLVCIVDDGTGQIALKQYFEQAVVVAEGQESPFAQYTVDSFVWALGALRTGSDPYVSITQIKKLSSANDIAYHILTTCSVHIDIIEEKDGTFGATPMRSFSHHNVSTTSQVNNIADATPSKQTTTSLPPGYLEEQVYQFIQSGKSSQWGFSKSDCAIKFKNTFPESEINKAIEQLLDDARIYDTGDEVHFKSIE